MPTGDLMDRRRHVTQIIPRSEWGARYGDGKYARPLPASEAWLHHSVTVAPDLIPPWTDDHAAIRVIDRVGAERFGSVYGFPYTFGITPAGLIFQGHAVGQTGAHTEHHNTAAIGVVLVGNYEKVSPTAAQVASCAWLLRECQRRGWLKRARLDGGHRDLKGTACPGKYAYALIDDINRLAANPQEGPDMSQYGPEHWDAADIAAFQQKLGWGTPMSSLVSDWTGPVSAIVRTTHKYAVLGPRQTAANAAALTVLAKYLADSSLTAEQIVQRVEQAIAEAVVSVDVTVTGEDTP
jgi:hypothetical protein